MGSVEQRARELLAAEYQREGIKGVEPEVFDADRAALRAIAAALREQPEARGVVDDVTRDAARWRKLIANTKTDHIWHFVLSEEHKEGHDHFLDVIDALPLTAAQQPVQEGGGEVATLCVDRTGAHIEMLPAWQSLSHGEYPLYTAPPSAPVEDRREIDRVIRELRAYNPAADEYRGEHIHGVWAKELERAITQQPAQAAPGCLTADEREWLDYAIEHMRDDSEPEDLTCADVLEALLKRATPPGDDAAGGGHG